MGNVTIPESGTGKDPLAPGSRPPTPQIEVSNPGGVFLNHQPPNKAFPFSCLASPWPSSVCQQSGDRRPKATSLLSCLGRPSACYVARYLPPYLGKYIHADCGLGGLHSAVRRADLSPQTGKRPAMCTSGGHRDMHAGRMGPGDRIRMLSYPFLSRRPLCLLFICGEQASSSHVAVGKVLSDCQ